jgi:hypothetical protein
MAQEFALSPSGVAGLRKALRSLTEASGAGMVPDQDDLNALLSLVEVRANLISANGVHDTERSSGCGVARRGCH